MTGYVFSIILLISLGVSVVLIFWPDGLFRVKNIAIVVLLGSGLGFGLSSLLFFLWLLVVNQSIPLMYYRIIEFIICLATLSLAILRVVHYKQRMKARWDGPARLSLDIAIPALFLLIALVFAVDAFVASVMRIPHGEWDAWAIWNLHARFIFRGGVYWQDMFSSTLYWSHPDYPFLLPAGIARIWSMAGNEELITPAIVAGAFTFASSGLLFAALWPAKGIKHALVAAIILLSTPRFLHHGSSQYADIPLGFYNLTTCALVLLWSKQEAQNNGLLFLSGVSIGLSIWTKNEGWPFLVAIALAILIDKKINLYSMTSFTKWSVVMLGLMPVLSVVTIFKLQLAPANDLFANQNIQILAQRFVDLNRHTLTAAAFIKHFVGFGGWKIPLLPLLVLTVLITGVKIPTGLFRAVRIIGITLLVVLVQYYFVYIFSPHNLAWHLITLERLFLHIFPSFLLLFFSITPDPLGWQAQHRLTPNRTSSE